jgi:hypothetical protein
MIGQHSRRITSHASVSFWKGPVLVTWSYVFAKQIISRRWQWLPSWRRQYAVLKHRSICTILHSATTKVLSEIFLSRRCTTHTCSSTGLLNVSFNTFQFSLVLTHSHFRTGFCTPALAQVIHQIIWISLIVLLTRYLQFDLLIFTFIFKYERMTSSDTRGQHGVTNQR